MTRTPGKEAHVQDGWVFFAPSGEAGGEIVDVQERDGSAGAKGGHATAAKGK